MAIYWMGRRDERRALERKIAHQPPDNPASEYQQSRLDDNAVSDGDNDSPNHIVSPPNELADYDSFYVGEDDDEAFIRPPPKQSGVVQTYVRTGYPTASKTVATGKSETVLVSAAAPPATNAMELPAGVEPLLVNLTVMAPRDMSFDPYYLKQTLDNSGLVHGDMDIYHYYRKPKLEFEVNRGQRLFSVANIVEPGYFDPENLETYRSPGIALFLQLPGPIDGVLAFEKMHQVAVMLAKQLGGILCDDKHNKITPQAVSHIKDQIAEYNLKLRTKLKHTVH